jgi:hypothetical protein
LIPPANVPDEIVHTDETFVEHRRRTFADMTTIEVRTYGGRKAVPVKRVPSKRVPKLHIPRRAVPR